MLNYCLLLTAICAYLVSAEKYHGYLSCTGIKPTSPYNTCNPQFVIAGKPSEVLENDCNPAFYKPVEFENFEDEVEIILQHVGDDRVATILGEFVVNSKSTSEIIRVGQTSCEIYLMSAYVGADRMLTVSLKTKPNDQLFGKDRHEKLHFVILRYHDSMPIFKSDVRYLNGRSSYWADDEILWDGIEILGLRLLGADLNLLTIQLFRSGSDFPVVTVSPLNVGRMINSKSFVDITPGSLSRNIELKIDAPATIDDLKKTGSRIELTFAMDHSNLLVFDTEKSDEDKKARLDLLTAIETRLSGMSLTRTISSFGHSKSCAAFKDDYFVPEYANVIKEASQLRKCVDSSAVDFVRHLAITCAVAEKERLLRPINLEHVVRSAAQGLLENHFRVVVISPAITDETDLDYFVRAKEGLQNVAGKAVLFVFAFARKLRLDQFRGLTEKRFSSDVNGRILVVDDNDLEGLRERVNTIVSSYFDGR